MRAKPSSSFHLPNTHPSQKQLKGIKTHRLPPRPLPRRHLPPDHPPPPGRPPARRMKQMKIIRIADPRHLSEQTPLAEEAGADMGCAGDAAQVQAVDADAGQDGGCQEQRGE